MSNLNVFQVQYKRDQNGNKRVIIPLVAILKEYQAYCIVQRIKCVVDAELCLAAALKKRFHYRCNLKSKVPTVSSSFESEDNCLAELMDVFVELATDGTIKHSHYRYMNGSRRCTHEDYHAQFAFGEVMSTYVADYNWYDQDKFKGVIRGALFLDCNKVLV